MDIRKACQKTKSSGKPISFMLLEYYHAEVKKTAMETYIINEIEFPRKTPPFFGEIPLY